MSKYYRPNRVRNVFSPASTEAFKLSRSKIDQFLRCPCCFYLDRRMGIAQPPSFPMNLNIAVDKLLKKEFDIHRAKQTAHPLMEKYGIDGVPFAHEKMDEWRENFVGVQYLHKPTNLIITGAVDDIWQTPRGELMVVDYKSTSKDGVVNIDAEWQIGYKRQMEIYQWLLRQNGFNVSDTGYFVYCNGNTDKQAFDAKLEFDVKVIPYTGRDAWVESTILNARQCLENLTIPIPGLDCDFCNYRRAVGDVAARMDSITT